MSRPISDEARARLRMLIAQGANTSEAARIVGVNRTTARLERTRMAADPVSPAVARPEPAGDPVDIRRLKGTVSTLRRDLEEMTRRASAAEDLRRGVFGLMDDPIAPVAFHSPGGGKSSGHVARETIVLFLSDLHWGERVDLGAMDGLNSYNLAIARARLKRYFEAVTDLATRHWSGLPPERLILILGGDLVSGEIHAELAKTNEAKALPAVRDLVEHLAGGILHLRQQLKCPIDVVSLAGNHGRSTLKPESKEAIETSYDTLVSDFLQLALKAAKGISFYVPSSVDALFSVYGWRVLATHGDRIGSRGGQGFVGPAATAARGLKRLVGDYAARGIHLDLILIGHLHTPLQLEEGYVNGSLPGPTEYSRDGRFRPHPAQQLFLTIHPRRGVAQQRWIKVGDASEGAVYAPPPEDRDLRPRWRVPAISIKGA